MIKIKRKLNEEQLVQEVSAFNLDFTTAPPISYKALPESSTTKKTSNETIQKLRQMSNNIVGDYNGRPYVGKPMMPQRAVGEEPVLASDFMVDVFYLDDPEDMKSYREVLNKIANDIYSLRERRVDENGSSYKVYIEYFRAFYTDSTTKQSL